MGTKKHARTSKQTFWQRHTQTIKKAAKWLGVTCLVLVLLGAGVWVAFQVSPWPNALLIRQAFAKNNAQVNDALQKYVPAGITQVQNQQYKTGDSDAYLDAFYPNNTTAPRPTVVWVHGGAWVAGNKDDIDNYLSILASHGFTAISVNYTLAPEKQYPAPILQLNAALSYIQQNAARLNVDTTHIALAGDSAGSQIVAQMANIITSPSYAAQIGIQPMLPAADLKAMLLNCGAYDLALPDYNGPFGKFLHTVLWAYSGTQDFLHDPKLATASVANYLTPQFPPSFITAGNVDPLLAQSTELAGRLQKLGVPTSTLFYPADHQPQLNHEYQFELDNTDGQTALQRMIDFLKAHN
ncbi:MAG TPA: alpha/beta hydrolase [Candidatus Saccharimonas sp.]|nr:alpha/beta hydrolase [Candidatus Saccharimonas sp.]